MKEQVCWSLCLILTVQGFTIKDELAALRRGPEDYAALHGMRLDQIEVETSDGWLLRVHRVRSMSIFDEDLSPPVLLSAGITCSSFDFMVNLRNESLAFILADKGFDVWNVNFRGNKFSNLVRRAGKIIKPLAKDYFRASWQDMAQHDVPAILDKILTTTNQSKVYMIGHSMGTTVIAAFLAENHLYDDKISLFIALSPAFTFGKDTSLVLKALAYILVPIIRLLPPGPIFDAVFSIRLIATPSDWLNKKLENAVGESCKWMPSVCKFLINVVVQRNIIRGLLHKDPHIRSSRTPIIGNKFPSGSPLVDAYLYGQLMLQDKWTKIDYDAIPQMGISNEHEYNQKKPPVYNLTDIRVSIELFVSTDDVITGPKTIPKLIEEIQPRVYHIIDDKLMTHQDTVWGWDARCSIYDKIIDSFDASERERAKAEDNNTVSHPQMKNKRDHYRRVTVPKFIETLPFQKTCPESSKKHSVESMN